MSRKSLRLLRIIIGGLLLLCGLLLPEVNQWVTLGVFIAAYIVSGGDIVLSALKNIAGGQIFDENFLMVLATVGAFTIGEYPEAIGVMLFYKVGQLFENYAVDKSRKSITELMDIRPDYANVRRGNELIKASPDEVMPGDIIVIKPGEKVPLDAKVIDGYSTLETSALTGESLPREVMPGSAILSGCININGLLMAEVTSEYGESTVSKILDLVENAACKKAKTENFITKFARYYTPVVVLLAVFIATVPPLVFESASFKDWLYRGLTFLVISCPCALVISIPLSFFGGIGGASRKGILIKGSNYLEALSDIDTIVFDKTGTLTKGVFKVQEIYAENIENEALLEMAAYTENFSNHPISLSLKTAYGKDIDGERVTDAEELPGLGVCAVVDGKTVYAGNDKLMKKMNIPYSVVDKAGTVVFVAVDGVYCGYIIIADEIKDNACKTIRLLKEAKIKKTVMLTGDSKKAGEKAAEELGIDTVFTELLPGDKVEKLEELLASAKGKVAYTGDGINDAPVLARADVGIAMGALGSDAAIEAADVVIMTDELINIPMAIKISKKTLGIVKQNIIFALGIKFAVLILAAAGYAFMWAGVLADVGVTVLAVLNAARALNVGKID